MTASASRAAYPVQPIDGEDDARFSRGLIFEVAKVIESHGYPPLTSGRDVLGLSDSLFRFIYQSKDAW